MNNTYYYTCDNCGANLDPCEKCDCDIINTTNDSENHQLQKGNQYHSSKNKRGTLK